MTQDEIRERAREIDDEIREHEEDITRLESEMSELWAECPHPNRGKGDCPDGLPAFPNQCPDCGHMDEKET
jgi:hypothetical protein